MLMSPPPEETLRTTRNRVASARASSAEPYSATDANDRPSTPTPKRKRNQSITKPSASWTGEEGLVASSSRVTLDVTPNPKPRKQSRHHVAFAAEQASPSKTSARSPRSRTSASPTKHSIPQSPHAKNPQADYIPPLASHSGDHTTSHRRYTTPVPYEPPAERFTPPREVFTPVPSSISKSSKRKTLPKSAVKGKRLTLQIKKEPPEVDLNEPPPPPSPTEDPLLLKGPPPSTKKKSKAPRASLASIASVRSRDTPPVSSSSPVRDPSEEYSRIQDLDFGNAGSDSDWDAEPLPPLSNYDNAVPVEAPEEWTDEDEDQVGTEFDHDGEYTGKFKILTVPTKQDPPSSTTRRRQDQWGRPISPFPYEKLRPSTAAPRHSIIPESPVREGAEEQESEIPIAEYDDEQPEAGPSRWKSPPPPPMDDEDVEMGDAADDGSSLPTSSPRRSPTPLPAEPIAGPSGHRHSDPPEAVFEEVEVAIDIETVLEVDENLDRLPPSPIPAEETRSPEQTGAPSEPRAAEPRPEGEVADTGSLEARPQGLRSELSYVDLTEGIPPVNSTQVEHIEAPAAHSTRPAAPAEEGSFEGTDDIEEARHAAAPSGPQRRVSFALPARERTFDLETSSEHAEAPIDARFDFSAGSEPSEEPDDLEPEDFGPQEEEWSFSVPQEEQHDEEMVVAEEEDAASVVRELSREPDEHGDERLASPEPVDESQEAQEPQVPQVSVPRMEAAVPSVPAIPKDHPQPPPVEVSPPQQTSGVVHKLSKRWSQLGQARSAAPSPVPVAPKPVPVPVPAPAPRAPRVSVPTFSPRNPFQTPGAAQPSAPRPPAHGGFQPLQTAPTPQFDLPEDELDESLLDPGIVKITSSDPMAAARAAAILRLHKYDCVETLGSPARPNASLYSALRSARRKSVLQSGVGKSFSHAHRSTLGGANTTLGELLRDAEATVLLEESHLYGLAPPAVKDKEREQEAGRTPGHASFEAARKVFEAPSGPRAWTKADWKALDQCYTEERGAKARERGLGDGVLVSAEEVDEERVVERFMHRIGGAKVAEVLGEAWTHDNLLRRVRALRRKQSARSAASPARQHDSFAESARTPAQNYSNFFSPNATMLHDLQVSAARTPATTGKVPTQPDDVRYTELLEEAMEVDKADTTQSESSLADPDASGIVEEDESPTKEQNRSYISPLLPGRAAHSLATKVKGLVFSYLRSPKQAPPKEKSGKPAANGPVLPVPPPEVFEKPRAPIITPVAKPASKPAPAKALVQLHPVPAPKPSLIPRVAPKPAQNWVRLNHVEPRAPAALGANAALPRERRDSSASVKDLVQTFESLDQQTAAERAAQRRLDQLKKRQSVKKWNEARMNQKKASKPVWR
ncbi:hypothetical protein PsYK624_028370 [Phanerochaete sordida]|uniref:Uncharacterized protein n=1 Tax=Phanerochaete sordida TaxID=48140 RepID=A0A9P3L918_9APHY|nr:hypothetical protein PsYK624_028370 [Phanerochaete sordida]